MKMDSLIPLAPRVFDLFDNNRDGTVDMREILCGFSSLRNSRGDDALRLCFQVKISKCTRLKLKWQPFQFMYRNIRNIA